MFEGDSGSGNVFKFDAAGTKSTAVSGLNQPNGVAVDRLGNLFVSDNGANDIFKYTPGGVQSTFATGLDGPSGLAFDSSGNLFDADNTGGNVYEFTPGGVRTTFATGISPLGLAFAPVTAPGTPEPGSLALATGVILSGIWVRRRRRN